MKTQFMKLAGASILAFSLSFFTFMSLTLIAQEKDEYPTIQAVQVEDTTLASVTH